MGSLYLCLVLYWRWQRTQQIGPAILQVVKAIGSRSQEKLLARSRRALVVGLDFSPRGESSPVRDQEAGREDNLISRVGWEPGSANQMLQPQDLVV